MNKMNRGEKGRLVVAFVLGAICTAMALAQPACISQERVDEAKAEINKLETKLDETKLELILLREQLTRFADWLDEVGTPLGKEVVKFLNPAWFSDYPEWDDPGEDSDSSDQ